MSKSIMFVGTNSSAGKSFFVTGLCRVLADEGYKVSPFKSQNMALNSYVDINGLEFGRAQAIQAFACKVKPNVNMNPILLKPNSDKKSDIILLGKKVDTYDAKQYYQIKSKYLPYIKRAYKELSDKSDIMVLEGAGSPAEINLLDGDFVNMGMAEISKSPVILVADIDKGGVFASIYGTIMLTPKKWQPYYKGIIINKFRGEKSILDSGIKDIEKLLNIPVISIMPYIDVDIEEEDSLTNKLKISKYSDDNLNISIIKLPNLSNFTEFSPLSSMEDVNINYISYKNEIPKDTDLLIIPPSKNIIKDLEILKSYQIKRKIKQYIKQKKILTVGNSTYMLCKTINDERNIYSNKNKVDGLGLIDAFVSLQEAQTKRIKPDFIYSQDLLKGISQPLNLYQIKTGIINSKNIAMKYKNEIVAIYDENILAIDAFGIFENEILINSIINNLRIEKGLNIKKSQSYYDYREKQIAKLAYEFRKNIDVEKIKKIIEIGV